MPCQCQRDDSRHWQELSNPAYDSDPQSAAAVYTRRHTGTAARPRGNLPVNLNCGGNSPAGGGSVLSGQSRLELRLQPTRMPLRRWLHAWPFSTRSAAAAAVIQVSDSPWDHRDRRAASESESTAAALALADSGSWREVLPPRGSGRSRFPSSSGSQAPHPSRGYSRRLL